MVTADLSIGNPNIYSTDQSAPITLNQIPGYHDQGIPSKLLDLEAGVKS